jgi:hypothetical protein
VLAGRRLDELIALQLIVGLFLSYPLGLGMRMMPNAALKHFYSFIVGFLMLQFVFGPSWVHTFITSMVTYLICMLAPKKYLTSTAFLFVMGYMTIAHCYRMYVSYMSGILDFTGTQMVMTMKLTSFAFNYFDGVHDYQNVFVKEHESESKKRMYADRRRFAVRELPSLLEYLGYMFCFTCILTGPAFEYTDYLSAVDGSAFNRKSKSGKTVRSAHIMMSSFLASLRRLAESLVSMFLYLKVGPIVGIKYMYDPVFMNSHGPIHNLLFCVASIGFDKMKYYFAWKLAEASCIMAGFGFEGYDEEGHIVGWKGVENIDIVNFELGSNVQQRTRYWNKRTQGWLERYVYNRTNKSLAITYFISAFWHGLYPGYFLFFLSLPMLTSIERLARTKLNPIFAPGYNGKDFETYPKTFVGALYYIICYINTSITLHYVGEVSSNLGFFYCRSYLLTLIYTFGNFDVAILRLDLGACQGVLGFLQLSSSSILLFRVCGA